MTNSVSAASRAKASTLAGDVPLIVREDAAGVTVLTLNRPDNRNALSQAMLSALSGALTDIGANKSVRAVVLAARGPAFCAGHDLKELTTHRSDPDGGRNFFEQIFSACGAVMAGIVALPQPVIAAIQGPATAAGCELVANCDLAIASPLAKFSTPGVDIGLFCSTPAIPISRAIERKHVMEMLLTGEMISAEKACQFGLINRVVAPGAEHPEAMDLARHIASKPAMTVQRGKKTFYQQIDMGFADAYRLGARAMVENMLTHDADEGIRAFLEKRPARWDER